MNTVDKLSPHHIEQLHRLYKQEWWSKHRTLEQTQKVVSGSQLCIAIVDNNNNLAGFARVLTDFVFKALIFDVIVANSSRKMGLGDKLISTIKNHPALCEVAHFELYCLPEMFAFYQRLGFSEELGHIKLMRHTKKISSQSCFFGETPD